MAVAQPQPGSSRTLDPLAVPRRSDRSRSVAPFVLLLGLFVVGALVEATPERATLFGVEGPVCPSRWLLGSSGCPGCGLTRGTALWLDGDFAASWSIHPAASLVVVLGGLGALLHAWVLLRGVRFEWIDRALRSGRYLFLAGLLASWLATFV